MQDLPAVYRIILRLPMLTYSKLTIASSDKSISLPIATQTSPIQHLFMNHSCKFNELSEVLSYTPELRHLSFMESHKNHVAIETILPSIPIHLILLHIHVAHVTFDRLEMFIRQLPTKLKVLKFSTSLEDLAYMDAYRWERFLQQDLPQLKKFSFEYHERNNKHQFNIDFREINPFFSSFWLQRRYTFEIQAECEHIVYSVRPRHHRPIK